MTAGSRVVGVISAFDLVGFMASSPAGSTDLESAVESVVRGDGDEEDEGAEAGIYFLEYWEDTGAGVLDRFEPCGTVEWNVLDDHTVA